MEVVFKEKPNHYKFKNIEGQIFNRLTVLGFAGKERYNKGSANLWWCECSCGNKTIIKVSISHLTSNHTVSCGCYKIETRTKHGMHNSPEYSTYTAAKGRCDNTNDSNCPDYGGRGIEFRFTSFEEFYDELGEKPEPKRQYSVDRIDNGGHYEKGNVKWATRREQSLNMRRNSKISFNGETKRMSEWSEIVKININTLYKRLLKLKWCVECTMTIKSSEGTCTHKNK